MAWALGDLSPMLRALPESLRRDEPADAEEDEQLSLDELVTGVDVQCGNRAFRIPLLGGA